MTAGDAESIASIYAHHVLHGTASYEVEPPSAGDIAAKIGRITGRGWPFLVACVDGEVAGYAYAEQLRDRPAYRFTCENSIYVHPDRVEQRSSCAAARSSSDSGRWSRSSAAESRRRSGSTEVAASTSSDAFAR